MRRCTTLLFLAGCGFSSPAGAPGAPGAPMIDAAVGGSAASGPDAAVCVAGVVDVCGMPDPTMAFDISSAATLNTDSDSRCKTVTVAGRDLCLIYATEVTITASGSLTVTGGRPLALVSASTMVVAGAIDAGSHGTQIGPAADDASCAFATNPDDDPGGAGGGAGGSFTLPGGNGGTGNTDKSITGSTALGGTHGATVSAPPLRGGCRGQKGGDEQAGGGVGGAGGHAGGALYLAARMSVSVAGSIRATGGGGAGGQVQAGGGGGGSGGMLVIESPSITIGGKISANGGAGGQGGGRVGVVDFTGVSGGDGALGTSPATGGFGANNSDDRFSTGGIGGAGTAATSGTDSILGGGGGGGAAGVIRLIGTTMLTGSMISPPPS